MTTTTNADIWRLSPLAWALLAVALLLVGVFAFDSLKYMVQMWFAKEEYSYAYLLPGIVLFMIWQKRERLERVGFNGSWAGVAVLLAGLGIALLGELSTLYIIVQYAVLLVLAALALTFMGWRGFKEIWVPLLLLAFMIPLPHFLYQEVSAQAQLLSSQLGVAFLKLIGISVFLDGNIIDLGNYKLQVAEACNGLRYLFPLMALGFIAAYFFKAPMWKRTIIFLSTIPITIFMNSFRIAVIGVLVEHRGRSAAEGFLHDFEGWVIFMACTAIVVGEMWLLARIGKERRSLHDVFALDFPSRHSPGTPVRYRSVPKPFLGAVAALVVATVAFAALPSRVESPLARKSFSDFPMVLGQWQGRSDRMESIYLDVLKLDDYILADFAGPDLHPVNFYVAYYASQRKGESAHSPRSCIPGGGWEIVSLTQREVDGATVAGKPLRVNRVLIKKGDAQQLVYYWFQQRGRNLTNEYLVKWYLFWDALTQNRTDGALVRVTAKINPSLDDADRELSAFARTVSVQLAGYIPG